MTFAYLFDVGPFRVRKYESVIIGLGTSVEVVSEEQKASLLDSCPCCWLMVTVVRDVEVHGVTTCEG